MKETKPRAAVPISPENRKKLKIEAASRGVTIQTMVDEAVVALLKAKTKGVK